MNRDALRLTIAGNRSGWGRSLGIVFGVGVGVALVLSLLSAGNALRHRDANTTWQNPGQGWVYHEEPPPALADTEIMAQIDVDYFGEQFIYRLDLAANPSSTVSMPWGDPVPQPGTYLASPALIDLIATVPPETLEDRYGVFAGVIPYSGLRSPDSLAVVTGQPLDQMSGYVIPELNTVRAGENPVYRTIIIVGGIAMFVPVLLFVSIVTQLGAAQRAERFATLRLIGASPRVVIQIAAIEMAVLSAFGALLGSGIWRAIRPLVASLSFDNGRFFEEHLVVTPSMTLVVGIMSVAASTAVASIQMVRAGIGPLGATSQQFERAPSPLRAVPLIGGFAVFLFAARSFSGSANTAVLEVLLIGGFALLSFGIVLIGPCLTWLISRIALRRTNSAAGVIAASRIQRHPAAVFRSVSGLVIAVFVASVFAGSASSVAEDREPVDGTGLLPLNALSAGLNPAVPVDPELARLTGQLTSIAGVTSVAVVWADQGGDSLEVIESSAAVGLGLISSSDAPYVAFPLYQVIFGTEPQPEFAPRPAMSIAGLEPVHILVGTDGSLPAMEQARTALERSQLITFAPYTRADLADRQTRRLVNSMATFAYIGIAITIVIAGMSLAVATAAAILDRRRIFGLLKLVGMPSGTLRNIVILEALVPLVSVVLLSIGLGFLVAWLIVEGLAPHRSVHWPDERYGLTVLASTLLAALTVIATLGIVRANTTVSQTRFE